MRQSDQKTEPFGTVESPLLRRLDTAIEVLWLAIIFLVPVYFNPLCIDVFYFAKSILFQFLSLLLLGLVCAHWITARRAKGSRLLDSIKNTPLETAVVIYGLIWVLSTLFSISQYRSLWGSVVWRNGLFSTACWIIFFLTIAQKMSNRRQILRALYTLLVSSALLSVLGIIQFINPQLIPWGSYAGRVFSTDGNPLSLSAVIAMTLPVTIAMMLLAWYGSPSHAKGRVRFALLLALFAAQLTCLALAQYSVTVLLFIIGLFVFFLLTGIYLRRKTTVILSVVFLVLLAVVAGALLAPSAGTGEDQKAPGMTNVSAPLAEQVGMPSLSIRLQVWKCAGQVILESPQIPLFQDDWHGLRRAIGYGPETFITVSQSRFPAELKADYTFKSAVIAQPENQYLYLGDTVGILGLLFFLAILAIFLFLGFRLLAGNADRETIFLVTAILAAVIQYCAHIFFNPGVVTTDMVFWLMLGLMAALARIHGDGVPQEATSATAPLIKSTIIRNTLAAAVVVLAISTAFSILFNPLMANMKQRSAFDLAVRSSGRFYTTLAESVNLQPQEAYYYGNLAYYAYSTAIITNDASAKSKLLDISEAAYNGGMITEPYLAYWSYALADGYLYHYEQGANGKLAPALQLYERADKQFPENAVILNKWSLALMQNGSLQDADTRLLESEKSDPSWAETSFFRGLWFSYQQNYSAGADSMVSQVKSKSTNLVYFLDFCGYTYLYGGIEQVQSALRWYCDKYSDDWVGYTMLGIADVFNNNFEDAAGAFKLAARDVKPPDANLFKSVVSLMGRQKAGFSHAASEIIRQMEEAPGKQ